MNGHRRGFIDDNSNGAIVENGYIYWNSSSPVIYSSGTKAQVGAALVVNNLSGATVRNVFGIFNSYYDGTGGGALVYTQSGTLSNVYHVGEYYNLSNNQLLNTEQLIGGSGTATSNVWHVTDYVTTYKNNTKNVQETALSVLADEAWHASVLGDAFDTENTVPLGFYPRLRLPTCMQWAQEYIPLPTLAPARETPTIVNDGWADELDAAYTHGDESGCILLRFRNPMNLPITGVTFSDLTTLAVREASLADDGLWNVVVEVKVADGQAYKSSYEVTGIRYISGGMSVSTDSAWAGRGYKTRNISFWKPISSAGEWGDYIELHLDWNYRLTKDISIAQIPTATAVVDGAGNEAFTGRLDGNMHTIKNVNFSTANSPAYLFYELGAGGVIENLIVENMTLDNTGGADVYAGLVRVLNGTAENVHLRDCKIKENVSATNRLYAGFLCGKTGGGAVVSHCSVADSTIELAAGSGVELAAGGLAGYADTNLRMSSCYARNVSLTLNAASGAGKAGGLVGRMSTGTVADCYASGTIGGAAYTAGGIVGTCEGSNTGAIRTCWSSVSIDVSGSIAGGIVGGSTAGAVTKCLAVGDVLCAGGVNVHRIACGGTVTNCYAFRGQLVTGVADGETDGCAELFTGRELRYRTNWVDIMGWGEGYRYDEVTRNDDGDAVYPAGYAWDYTPLAGDLFPRLLEADGVTLVWGQEGVQLPSQYNITVLENGTGQSDVVGYDQFTAVLQIDHRPLSLTTAEAMRDQIPAAAIAADGLSRDTSVDVKYAYTDEYTTVVTVTFRDCTKALDYYMVTLQVWNKPTGEPGAVYEELRAQVKFGGPVYWYIPNLAKWNEVTAEHGMTGENFRITGMVDFGEAEPERTGLLLGRLEGWYAGSRKVPALDELETMPVGFKNLRYTADSSGTPWIASVANAVEGLKFENMYADYRQSRNQDNNSSFIGEAGSITDCLFEGDSSAFEGDSYYTLRGYQNNTGLIGKLRGNADNIKLSYLRIVGVNFVGALAGQTEGGTALEHVTADHVKVSGSAYVGIVAGLSYSRLSSCTSTNCTVGAGALYSGCVAGYVSRPIEDVTVTDCTITGTGNYVGGVAGNAGGEAEDITLTNVTVTGGEYVGGAFGRSGPLTNITLTDCTITGEKNYTGGVVGYHSTNGALANITVTGCTIGGTSNNAGGIAGNNEWLLNGSGTVSNTTVTGRNYVGGAFGGAGSYGGGNIDVIDCTVTGTSSVGGVFGELRVSASYFSVLGTTVTGTSDVGGVAGRVGNHQYGPSRFVVRNSNITATSGSAGGAVG
ncbi:MAG: hypothetical protein IJQ98_11505, partial [Oscillospiraceae bacterium]|nr:hypothetical protein [Oscillospiraceae bacterium]